MRIKDRLQQEQGFTLIELMAVLAILTMLVLIAVPAIGSITKKAEAQADDATISMIEKAGGLALLGDVAYDDPEEEQYEVSTLVEEGYLDIDESHKYAGSGNTVTRIKGYEFEFEGVPNPEDIAAATAAQLEIINIFLNDAAHWVNADDKGNTNLYAYQKKYAWLNEPYDMALPTGDYRMGVSSENTGNLHLVLMTYDEHGVLLDEFSGYAQSTFPFSITDEVSTIKLRASNRISRDESSVVNAFSKAWIGDTFHMTVLPK